MKRYLQVLTAVVFLGLGSVSFALDAPEASKNGTFEIQGNWSELKVGWNMLTLKVMDPEQQTAQLEDLLIAYDMIGMPMNPPNNPITQNAEGNYQKKIFLGMPGKWKFDIKLKGSAEDSLTKMVLLR